MSGVTVEIKGLQEIDRMFQQLPKQVNQDAVWAKFWRLNSKPLIKAAKQNAPVADKDIVYPADPSLKIKKGTLRDSIIFYRTKASKKYYGGYVGPRVKGKYKKNKGGYFGAWVEYGHKSGHKGNTKAFPFMEKAWGQAHGIVLTNGMKDSEKIFTKVLKSHEKRLQKYGSLGY